MSWDWSGYFTALATLIVLAVSARYYRFQIRGLEVSLKHWQGRHAAILEEANRAWVAAEELMVNRLGYTHQAASDAIYIWRRNGYGKPRLGGVEIIPDMND